MPKRSDVMAVARGYVGTKFVHQGRTPGLGLDCVGIPLCVAEALKIVDKNGKPMLARDDCRYGPQPQSDIVYNRCKDRLIEIPELREGCIIALKLPTVACHSAIVTRIEGKWYMVHADSKIGHVVETLLTDRWVRRIKGSFDYVGIED